MTRKRKYDPALGGILGPGSSCPDYPITGFGCCARPRAATQQPHRQRAR